MATTAMLTESGDRDVLGVFHYVLTLVMTTEDAAIRGIERRQTVGKNDTVMGYHHWTLKPEA